MMHKDRVDLVQLRAQTDLVSIIAETVPLKRQGSMFIGLCPLHRERTPSFVVTPSRGTWHCFGCGAHGDVFDFIEATMGIEFPEAVRVVAGRSGMVPTGRPLVDPNALRRLVAAREHRRAEDEARQIARAQRLLAETVEDDGIVGAYLRARGLSGTVPATLRLHRSLSYWKYNPETGGAVYVGVFPAMVAVVRQIDGTVTAAHRVYLAANGQAKASVSRPKKAIGKVSGGAIHLGAPADRLCLAEGIETAMCVQESVNVPTWATVSASNMDRVDIPDSVRDVLVWADHDPAGLAAAEKTRARHHAAGRHVRVFIPPQPGADWLDVAVAAEAMQA
jgi:DNA primase